MLDVRPAVAAALAEGRPVVALESAFLTHGLPAPHGLAAARAMAAACRDAGAVPAMVAVMSGQLVVGIEPGESESLARAAGVVKVSRRDLGPVLAGGGLGGTTVSATLTAAAAAGVRLLATGGIGGVHRGDPPAADVSADLPQIGRAPVAVVCSGAKIILDLPRTLELLETLGVPVLGYGTSELPAFYSRRSGLALEHRVDGAPAAAAVLTAHWQVERTGVVVAVPPPAGSELDPARVEPLIERALGEAREAGITGPATTPFLLDRLARASDGRAVEANLALLANNARIAAAIATALAAARKP
jgi:pseudouridine-5'-phosphate glycosidase